MTGCSNSKETNEDTLPEIRGAENDALVASFSFVGCNRINTTPPDPRYHPSTANVPALKRIFKEAAAQTKTPDLFFFIGDMVQGKHLDKIPDELDAWKALYNNSEINVPDIEMVAIPGNHEMLKKGANGNEVPLNGSMDIWIQKMEEFMPKDRDSIKHNDDPDIGYHNNRATFSFIRELGDKKVAFIIINTDTYDKTQSTKEGITPTDWILNKANEYQQNSTIDLIFILGHKPCFTGGHGTCSEGADDCNKPCFKVGHGGLPNSPELWKGFNKNTKVIAYLSAHLHCYQRWQPDNKGTFQVIAGHGGSSGESKWFGYSTINIYKDKKVELVTMGFSSDPTDTSKTTILEKLTLNYDNTRSTGESSYKDNCDCLE